MIETKRLILRQWLETDAAAFAQLNADPQVMEFFPATLTQAESNAHLHRLTTAITERGWGLWAVEVKEAREFIGFTGLNIPFFPELPFCPCTEVGWRLAPKFWGKGYATEAAQASLKFAFDDLGLDEVVAFTPILNVRSAAVMQRLGMVDTRNNFLHPAIPAGNKLQEHLLYRITRSEWTHARLRQG